VVCTDPKARNAILSYGWPEPLQGGARVSLPASAFGSWVKLIDSPGITASSHSRWINSTAAWGLGQVLSKALGVAWPPLQMIARRGVKGIG
jgi:hypothetical protein